MILKSLESKIKSESVAFDNKVMDTCLPQPVGCGGKYYAGSRGEYGRSMIEMLGVLAIIGVLTVGGISGYSKAMMTWKINKTLEEYSYLLYGLVEHIDELKYSQNGNLTALAQSLNLIPNSWIMNKYKAKDSLGNTIRILHNDQQNLVLVDFYFGDDYLSGGGKSSSAKYSQQICVSLMQNIVQPLHQIVAWGNTFSMKSVDGNTQYKMPIFQGDTRCNGRNCLKDASLQDFQKACEVCDGESICCVSIYF